MDKKPSYLWALLAGVLFTGGQVAIFMTRFGGVVSDVPLAITDYLIFFLAGAFIGAGLIYFLRRSETPGAFRAVIIAFVVSLPFILFAMIVGGMVGAFGVLILSVSPAIFITGIGYLMGRLFSKKK